MENVVYLLGAGFSAPLGLPVMKNFLSRSKDLFQSNTSKYASFGNIFDVIKDLSKAKNYYEVDLHNIEEILSILDMEDWVKQTDRSPTFAEYIRTVIKAYTPQVPVPRFEIHEDNVCVLDAEWPKRFFGEPGRPVAHYGNFVGNLLNLVVEHEPVNPAQRHVARLRAHTSNAPQVSYAVVTLNYDMIIENYLEHIRKYCLVGNAPRALNLSIAKLHGSVNGEIVAPTWKKQAVKALTSHWQQAYECLSRANHIRVLGYSLPVSDAYVRYLLEAAVNNCEHLKTIDVICLNNKAGEVSRRYKEFITYRSMRFANQDLTEYISAPHIQPRSKKPMLEPVYFTGLEQHHEDFMKKHEMAFPV